MSREDDVYRHSSFLVLPHETHLITANVWQPDIMYVDYISRYVILRVEHNYSRQSTSRQ